MPIQAKLGESVRLRFSPSSPLVATVMSGLAGHGFRHVGPGQWVAEERALPALVEALDALEPQWTVRAAEALRTACPALQHQENSLSNPFGP